MQLNELNKHIQKSRKRLGRGIGSGRGKTSGRGMKGQKARGKIPAAFVGGSLPLYKKLPYRRGWGNRQVSSKHVLIKTSQLSNFKNNAVISTQTLIESGLVTSSEASKKGVKITADTALANSLKVEVSVTKKAQEFIETAGGVVMSK